MMTRPYLNYSIQQLEEEFTKVSGQEVHLITLLTELTYRSTTRSKKLRDAAEQRLNHLRNRPPKVSQSPKHTIDLNSKHVMHRTKMALPQQTYSFSAGNPAQSVLRAWSALEVLSPQSFFRTEQLAAGSDPRLVSVIRPGALPWDGKGETSRFNYRLYYHVILGTVKVPEVVQELLKVYADHRAEEPAIRGGEAVMASILVDQKGRLVDDGPAVAISSFGWGVARVLSGRMAQLGEWPDKERELTEQLEKKLRCQDEDGEDLPLDFNALESAYDWLIREFGLPAELVKKNLFVVRNYQYLKTPGPPDPLLLNSFYLNDLSAVQKLQEANKLPENLKKYLGALVPNQRINLLKETIELEKVVAPQLIPSGRWPGPGRRPLVLLQQGAVNLALNNLQNNGILPVNGPPGTGKTTLLRDVLAGLITQRAAAFCAYDNPKEAFIHSGEKINIGSNWLHLYKLHPDIKGYEMLITSSNNKAVENVSAELPASSAIAKDVEGLRYFKTLSDALHQKDTWGLAAAVLGNAVNRSSFMKTFWWDPDIGLRTYLMEACGTPQWIEVPDPNNPEIPSRIRPQIVTAEQAPSSPEQALHLWREARIEFLQSQEEVNVALERLAQVRAQVQELPGLQMRFTLAKQNIAGLKREVDSLEKKHRASSEALQSSLNRKQHAETKLKIQAANCPGFWSKLFRTTTFKLWNIENQALLGALNERLEDVEATQQKEITLRQEVQVQKLELEMQQRDLRPVEEKLSEMLMSIVLFRDQSGQHLIDDSFWSQEKRDIQLASPWCNSNVQRLRDRFFISAMKLHKAFIDAAAQPMRHNLNVLMMALSGKKMPDENKKKLLPDLWSTLFLVVPSISTTFASVNKMFGDLPPEALGWLLVDEAGQALPQAAVGALMRTKRAVIVGDPVQIEPIVSLPDTLTQSICKYFEVDADRFNAPNASVQTVADQTSVYTAEFNGANGTRVVGVPLLVHRRCAQPMFAISNQVAYNKQMILAKLEATSLIRDLLGPSRWFDVKGTAQDKWCLEEGQYLLGILGQLKKSNIEPDLYIISPFVTVAENLRRLVTESGILQGWVTEAQSWPAQRIGTVHTVQGREAEAVIFVLGAPLAQQEGARKWAGSQPNLLNVAVTRAKEAIYVIGNETLWRAAGEFASLNYHLT
jgi:hypothetical protein